MKKMTAVEWLIGQLNNYDSKMIELFNKEIQQANVMFGEQIKLAFTQGELFSGDFYDPNNPNIDCSENYYNETYNK